MAVRDRQLEEGYILNKGVEERTNGGMARLAIFECQAVKSPANVLSRL